MKGAIGTATGMVRLPQSQKTLKKEMPIHFINRKARPELQYALRAKFRRKKNAIRMGQQTNEVPHVLVDTKTREVIKRKMLTLREAEARNLSIESVGFQWVRGE